MLRSWQIIVVGITTIIGVGGHESSSAQLLGGNMNQSDRLLFATFATDSIELKSAAIMFRSLREFGGRFAQSPGLLVIPKPANELIAEANHVADQLGLDLHWLVAPNSMPRLPLAWKAYAAAEAESVADLNFPLLAWLDNDAVFTDEPTKFALPDTIDLGYRPVQIVNISSVDASPPSALWERLYRILGIAPERIFPMTTTIDQIQIRAHFNAGMLIVRPKVGLLRAWPGDFEKVATDSLIKARCAEHQLTAIFLHQAALTGAILRLLPRERMHDIGADYNYAYFLCQRMPDSLRATSLDRVVMFRHHQSAPEFETIPTCDDDSEIFRWFREQWQR